MAYNNDRRDNRRGRSEEPSEFTEKVVSLNRVSKTVKGGRVMKFSALCVVGDGKGRVGYGLGKANEISEAIRKGLEDAKKNITTITLSGTTISHEAIGVFGAGRVLLKPAPEGTGVIAGGAVRAVVEAAGIKDIRTKCLRSNNPQNVVAATMVGLKSLRNAEQVAACRGKTVDEILG
ncbi:MAG: 30S ribosomal protein S5 [Oscillospiraceae bacterium]